MKRILIVDDNEENLYLLELLLRGNGYEVMSARNGAQALETARQRTPDLIVSDILMPVMDGYTLCREWKTDGTLSRVPFVFYTATYTEPENEAFALSIGADRFVTKPQEPVELERIVRELLERRAGSASPDDNPLPPITEEKFHQEYSKTLFRKLEKKQSDIEVLTLSLFCEMDERRKLEEQLSGCAGKLCNLLDASPAAIVWADLQGNVLFMNRKFTSLFGYRAEDLPTVADWFAKAYPGEEACTDMMRAWAGGNEGIHNHMEIVPVETRIRCKDGEYRDVSVADAVISNIHLIIINDLPDKTASSC